MRTFYLLSQHNWRSILAGKRCLLLLGFLFLSAFGFDCPYEECICYTGTIYCDFKGFNAVPPIVSNNTDSLTFLILRGNNITAIPAGSLPSNLTDIFLDFNPIETIDDSAFNESLSTLETLHLIGARLTRIPDALLHVRVFKYFTIVDVNISDWNHDVMRNIGATLKTLTISNVGIIESPTWLQYFSQLELLMIFSSFLTSLPDNVLDNVTTSLSTLSLYNNSFIEVPKAISTLTNLNRLNLDFNRISNLTWLPPSNLSTMTLNNNQLSDSQHLSSNLLPYAESLLDDIDLHGNQFTQIPDLSFFRKVKKFDLTYNRISDIDSGSVPVNTWFLDLANNLLPAIPRIMSNMTFLNDMMLSFNVITAIKGEEFPPKVLSVHLENNLITELNDTCFPLSSTIHTLSLKNNPIVKISDNAFINTPLLNDINLAGAQVTRLPLALLSVRKLNTLDASNITGLICTCEEKSLGPLILSLESGNIQGKCGVTNIYTFFANFSSSCP